jgi:spore maturation protein CgeB
MRMIYQGPLWTGSTALQRANAFRHWLGDGLIAIDDGRSWGRSNLAVRAYRSILWRAGCPIDERRSVKQLQAGVLRHRPDVVFVDSNQFVSGRTLRRLREVHPAKYVFYTPDDIIARHNRSRWLRSSFREWDVFFTTKTFNVPELAALGVERPSLVGKAFDPDLHRPMSQGEVGPEYERFDAVFLGAFEPIRLDAVRALAQAGLSVLVCCRNWPKGDVPPRVELRDLALGTEYVRALHYGKFALGFLRRINRDRITQRSMEITACGRPMVADKTDEHDAHFVDGEEYLGFSDIPQLVSQAKALLENSAHRQRMGKSGRQRCLDSGYSTLDRARHMLDVIEACPGPH